MKTMSGSVSKSDLSLSLNLCFFTALLHCPWGVPPKLQLQDWHLVPWCRPLHYALWQSAFSRKLRAGNHRKCHQGRFPFQSRAFLTTLLTGKRIPTMHDKERRDAKIHCRISLQPPLDSEPRKSLWWAYQFACDQFYGVNCSRARTSQSCTVLLLSDSDQRQLSSPQAELN